MPAGEAENFTKNVEDKVHENWLKFLEILKKIRVKVRPHYAARQNATHCSFATRQKLLGICR